jgi:hypothetical protein
VLSERQYQVSTLALLIARIALNAWCLTNLMDSDGPTIWIWGSALGLNLAILPLEIRNFDDAWS